NSEQDRTMLDGVLERGRARRANACALERRRHAACDVAGRLPQPRRERAGSDDRANPWKDERNGGEDLPGQFTQTRRRTRILEIRPWRRVHLLGERAFLIV